jgi:hypothetical protein
MLLHRIQRDGSHQREAFKGRVVPEFHSKSESTCPICRSQKVLFSKFQGILEHTIFRFLSIYPFWCNGCDSRFYLFSKSSFIRQESQLQ